MDLYTKERLKPESDWQRQVVDIDPSSLPERAARAHAACAIAAERFSLSKLTLKDPSAIAKLYPKQ
jgi:hypothetical protein